MLFRSVDLKRDAWFNDPVTNPIQDKNYIDLFKEKGAKEYFNHALTSSGVSYGEPSEIYMNRSMYFPFNKKGLESSKIHEATHAMESNGLMFNAKEKADLLEPFGLTEDEYKKLKSPGLLSFKDPKYFTDPTEIHARMNEVRYQLGLKPGEPMTKEMYNKAYKLNKFEGMGPYIKDSKKMLDLFNKFYVGAPLVAGSAALANSDKQKDGGWLNKYK